MTPQGLSIILPTVALPWFGHLRNGDIGGLPDFCLIVSSGCVLPKMPAHTIYVQSLMASVNRSEVVDTTSA